MRAAVHLNSAVGVRVGEGWARGGRGCEYGTNGHLMRILFYHATVFYSVTDNTVLINFTN